MYIDKTLIGLDMLRPGVFLFVKSVGLLCSNTARVPNTNTWFNEILVVCSMYLEQNTSFTASITSYYTYKIH